MSKLATLLIAAALFSPTFVQAMPKAPAMTAGDESTMPTPEKAKTAKKANRHKKAKKLPPPADPATTDNPAKP